MVRTVVAPVMLAAQCFASFSRPVTDVSKKQRRTPATHGRTTDVFWYTLVIQATWTFAATAVAATAAFPTGADRLPG